MSDAINCKWTIDPYVFASLTRMTTFIKQCSETVGQTNINISGVTELNNNNWFKCTYGYSGDYNRSATLSKYYPTYCSNHHKKFEIDRTILTCLH